MKKDNSRWWFLGLGILIGVIITMMLQPGEKIVIGDTEWEKAFYGEEAKILYLGRPTCGWCNKFKPGLDNLSEQFNIEYTYVNIDEIDDSEFDRLMSTLGLNPNEFGTPYTAIVKDGNKVVEQPGAVDEENLFHFLQDNGFIDKNATYAPNEKTINFEE